MRDIKNTETQTISKSRMQQDDGGENLDYELFILLFITFSMIIAATIALFPLSDAARQALIFINLIISIILIIDYFRMLVKMQNRLSFFYAEAGWCY